MKDSHDVMFQKARSITFSEELSKKEVLEERIRVELEQLRQNSSIFLILFKEFPPNEKNSVSVIMEDFRLGLIQWHKQCLLEAFGDKVTKNIWDLVAMYEGIMKEYISLITFHRVPVSMNRLVSLVASSLEAIANPIQNMEPVLTKELVCKPNQGDSPSLRDEIDQQLLEMENKLSSLSLKTETKDKLVASLAHLKDEVKKDNPEIYLLEALTSYLKTQDELKSTMQRIEQLITNICKEEEKFTDD